MGSEEKEAPEEGTQEAAKGGTQEETPEGETTPEEGAVEAMATATGATITPIMTILEVIIVTLTTIGQSKNGAQRAQG